jgi:hypothetical protein
MNPPAPSPEAKPKSLAQQQTDFTAEGSPPPDKETAAAPDRRAAPHAAHAPDGPDAPDGARTGHKPSHPGKR